MRSRKRGDRRSSLPPAPASNEVSEPEAASLASAEDGARESEGRDSDVREPESEAATDAAALEPAPAAAIEAPGPSEIAERAALNGATASDTLVDAGPTVPPIEAATPALDATDPTHALDAIDAKTSAESARRQAVTAPAPAPAPAVKPESEPEPTEPDATPLGLDVSGRQPSSPEMEEVFFNSVHPQGIEPEEEEEHPHARRFSEAAKARRSHLARYVKATVGTAMAIVLVAGLVRLASPTQSTSRTTTTAGPEIVAANPATEPAKPIAPAASPTTPATPTAAASANADPAIVATASAAPIASAPTESAAPVASAATAAPKGTGDAAHERAAAQAALESGRTKDAIAAGERSVAIDPTDGNAWLILGAAYQENRDMANARRCYRSCVDQAKRGSIGECRALAGR